MSEQPVNRRFIHTLPQHSGAGRIELRQIIQKPIIVVDRQGDESGFSPGHDLNFEFPITRP